MRTRIIQIHVICSNFFLGNVFTLVGHSVHEAVYHSMQGGRHPPRQRPPPGQTPPGRLPLADTLIGQTHPARHTLGRHPLVDTPLGRHTSPRQTPRVNTSPGQTPHHRYYGIWPTSRRYTSYWNDFLFCLYLNIVTLNNCDFIVQNIFTNQQSLLWVSTCPQANCISKWVFLFFLFFSIQLIYIRRKTTAKHKSDRSGQSLLGK